jgi:GGDEF domain-containing protein
VFRIGGDEFAVVIDDVEDTNLEGPVARVRRAVEVALEPFDGRASIGASWIPAMQSGMESFVHADTVLYAAKKASREEV